MTDFAPGDTFYGHHDPRMQEYKHLWILAHVLDTGHYVLVNVATVKPHYGDDYDKTCVLKQGQHPFLTQPESYVRYKSAIIHTADDLIGDIHLGRMIPREKLDSNILGRVQRGILEAPNIPRGIRNAVQRTRNR